MIKKDFSSSLIENESIIKQADRHWIVYIFSLIFIVAFSLVCFSLFFYRGEIEYVVGNGLFWGLFSISLIIVTSLIILVTLNNLLSTLLVTNSRVIVYEHSIPLGYQIRNIHLREITEIHGESIGILPTLFGYGSIRVGYAGGTEKVNFTYAKNINEILESIHALKKNTKKID